MKTLKKGDRVILKANHPYSTGQDNPCEGSEWFCEGTITSRDESTLREPWVQVRWDNKESNHYSTHTDCLELANEGVLL